MKEEVRVVVVDDDVAVADSLAELLTLSGYAVQVARDGLGALALISEFEPLCAIVDVHLPGADGPHVGRRVRDLYGGNMVLIAMSGGGSTGSISETLSSFDFFMRKPMDFDALQRILPPVAPVALG